LRRACTGDRIGSLKLPPLVVHIAGYAVREHAKRTIRGGRIVAPAALAWFAHDAGGLERFLRSNSAGKSMNLVDRAVPEIRALLAANVDWTFNRGGATVVSPLDLRTPADSGTDAGDGAGTAAVIASPGQPLRLGCRQT